MAQKKHTKKIDDPVVHAEMVAKNTKHMLYSVSGIGLVIVLSIIAMYIYGTYGKSTGSASSQQSNAASSSAQSNEQETQGKDEQTIKEGAKPMVEIVMENGKKIVLELYPEYAPKTVENFVGLVKKGFYDGLTFHRIISGFMIQGGDPKGTGMGGSDTTIPGEFSQNGFTQNTLKHTRGVISMARSGDPNSASSQFFIMHADYPSLDGGYAAFGKVVTGLEVVDELAKTPVNGDSPVNKPVIKKISLISE